MVPPFQLLIGARAEQACKDSVPILRASPGKMTQPTTASTLLIDPPSGFPSGDVLIVSLTPNVRGQAGRAKRAQHATERRTRPCLHRACSAIQFSCADASQ